MSTIHDPHRLVFSAYRMVRSYSTEQVRTALAPVGLNDGEIARGRGLLAAVQATRPKGERLRLSPVVSELLDWSRANFPVFRAVLHDTNLLLEAAVFDGVSPEGTSSDLYFVELVCQRVLALHTSAKPSESAAWAALAQHGASDTELASVLARCADDAHFETPNVEAAKAYTEALEALAAYHRKWSRIARARIKDRTVLHMMGIGRFGARRIAEAEEAEEASQTAQAAPVTGSEGATQVAPGATAPVDAKEVNG